MLLQSLKVIMAPMGMIESINSYIIVSIELFIVLLFVGIVSFIAVVVVVVVVVVVLIFVGISFDKLKCVAIKVLYEFCVLKIGLFLRNFAIQIRPLFVFFFCNVCFVFVG